MSAYFLPESIWPQDASYASRTASLYCGFPEFAGFGAQTLRAREFEEGPQNWDCLDLVDQQPRITCFQLNDEGADSDPGACFLEPRGDIMFEPSMSVAPTAPCTPSDSVYLLSPWGRGPHFDDGNLCDDIRSLREETLPMFSHGSAWATCTSATSFPGPTTGFESTSILNRRAQSSPSVNDDWSEFQRQRATPELFKCRIEPVKPSKAAAQKHNVHSHQCQSCDRSFRYLKDLVRHDRSVHAWQSGRWFCPFPGCKRGTQGFSRKDKFFQHIKTHASKFGEISNLEQIAHSCYHSGDLELKYSSPRDIGPDALLKEECRPELLIPTTSTSHRSPSLDMISRSNICEQTVSGSLNDFETEVSLKGQKRSYNCTVLGCQSGFVYHSDLLRHKKTVHMNQGAGEGYRCASVGCAKADKIWSRLDNFKQHAVRKHGDENIEQLVQKSSRSSHGTEAGFPFAITTPEMVFQQHPADSSKYP